MGAALALGAALGVPALAVAELLPGIEAAMVAAANVDRDGGGGRSFGRTPLSP